MIKVKYNLRNPPPKMTISEKVEQFTSFKLAMDFVRSELLGNENLIGKPLIEGEDVITA